MCSYRGGNSWRNVNDLYTLHLLKQLGDLAYSGGYIDGKPNTNVLKGMFATGNSWDATTNQVSSINMVTESNAGLQTAMAATRNRATSMCDDFNLHISWWYSSQMVNTIYLLQQILGTLIQMELRTI